MIWTLVFLLAMGGLVGQHFSLRRNLGYFYLAVAFWVCFTIKSRFHKKNPGVRGPGAVLETRVRAPCGCAL